MKMKGSNSKRYLISAIFFTVIAVLAGILFLLSDAGLFGKGCAIVLVTMCITGQWMRYNKFK